MNLDGDVTRCRGEGNYGHICPRRRDCQRYLAIEADVRWEAQSGRRPYRSYATMLCRPPQWAYFWGVENVTDS